MIKMHLGEKRKVKFHFAKKQKCDVVPLFSSGKDGAGDEEALVS